MYMNLKPNKHKRISFNATAMTSLGFIDAAPSKFSSPSKLFFCSGRPPAPPPPSPNYFGLKFLGPPIKLEWGMLLSWLHHIFPKN